MDAKGLESRTAVLMTMVMLWAAPVLGHDHKNASKRSGSQGAGHRAATYEITPAMSRDAHSNWLLLDIRDKETQKSTAARFTIRLNEAQFVPQALGKHGLRFVSVHQAKRQRFVVTYGRGTGVVAVPIPNGVKRGRVKIVKGLDYLPLVIPFDLGESQLPIRIELTRWSPAKRLGWVSADAHVHYERQSADHDRDWLAMLAADDLAHADFMVLRGGNLPGVWAQQYAYGPQGVAQSDSRSISPGEEYRDGGQGHINLLGIRKVIEPISTGGIGQPRVAENFPPLLEVLREARQGEAIVGPAHGGSLARSSTAALDTVLGEVDFLEIANTHLFRTDVWYQLLNCGYARPPLAGTDLPNFPFRDSWQPFLGEVRTYYKVGDEAEAASWKSAVRSGETFVSSGPMIRFRVDSKGIGQRLSLPEARRVTLFAEISSPRELTSLEVIQNGKPIGGDVVKRVEAGLHIWTIRQQIMVSQSCWLAARGTGLDKPALFAGAKIKQPTIAHTAAVQVRVAGKPLLLAGAIDRLARQLAEQQEYYRNKATYRSNDDRARFMRLFQQAQAKLTARKQGN